MTTRNIKVFAMLAVLLVIGVIVWQYQNSSKVQNISNFDECAKAGYPIMESYPEQCRTPDGRTFTRQVPSQVNRQEQTVDEIGLRFSYPNDLTFRKEVADDYGRIRNLGFYLEKGSPDKPTYMLYGLYQFQTEAAEADLEKAKTEMDKTTIKEITLDGYKGIEGLILGPKTRYITIILKDGKLFSVSTIPPTQGNKELTDMILATFDFK